MGASKGVQRYGEVSQVAGQDSLVRGIVRGLPGLGGGGFSSAPLGCHVESHEKGLKWRAFFAKRKNFLRCVSPKPQRHVFCLLPLLAKALCFYYWAAGGTQARSWRFSFTGRSGRRRWQLSTWPSIRWTYVRGEHPTRLRSDGY